MSIVASVKVYDGIVLGADSMTQVMTTTIDNKLQIGVLKTYSNANKIFRIKDLSMGILTYGAGNIGRRSIESYLLEFVEDHIKGEKTVGGVTEALLKFFGDAYSAHYKDLEKEKWPQLGVFVGGYSENEKLPEEWEFRHITETKKQVSGTCQQV